MKRILICLIVLALPLAHSKGQFTSVSATVKDCNENSKPTTGNGIQYASSTGSDTNDGLSWGTAKATIYAAMLALPGAVSSPPQAGTGTIYFGENVTASTTTHGGIWIMGSADPNYSRPPAGWIRAPASNASLRFIGDGCKHTTANNPNAQCLVNAGAVGGSSSRKSPAIWLSGLANSMYWANLLPNNPGKSLVLGVCSNGDRNGACGIVNQHFFNVAPNVFQQASLLNGPAVDIASNVFDIWFDHLASSGNPTATALITSSGLSRASNTVTVRLTVPTTGIATGDNCGILGASDPSFNFSAPVTVSRGGLMVSMTQPAPNAPDASSGGGALICDRSAVIVVNPGKGTGAGLIYLTNSEFNGGGVRIHGGTSAASFSIEHFYMEGSGSPVSPALWYTGGQGANFNVNDVQQADQISLANNAVIPIIKIEFSSNQLNTQNAMPGQMLFQGIGGRIEGAASLLGTPDTNASKSPYQFGQQGVFGGHLFGQTDVARSSPQSVRFTNIAPTNPASWSINGAGGSITTGINDRDGGTNAGKASMSGSGLGFMSFVNGKLPVATGDIIICGVWVRSLGAVTPYVGAGYQGNPLTPLACGLSAVTFTTTLNMNQGSALKGDGEWEWVWQLYKIGSQTGGSGASINFNVALSNSLPIAAYSPVLLHIAAGTISDNEAVNLAYNLRGYLNTCSVGQVCDALGPYPNQNVNGGTCVMSSGTTCTLKIRPGTGTRCNATVQGSTPISSACNISGSTVTVTAASSNSATWSIWVF